MTIGLLFTITALTAGLLSAAVHIVSLRADVKHAQLVATNALGSLVDERDERQAMRDEAFRERQDLYRRIQAPETGAYTLEQQTARPDGTEPQLHVSEDDEIAEALARADRETAGIALAASELDVAR